MPRKSLSEEEKLIFCPLGEAIKYFCKKQGITAKELAHRSGIDRSTISCIINGKSKPRYIIIRTICDTLNIPQFVIEAHASNLPDRDMNEWLKEIIAFRKGRKAKHGHK